MAKTKRSKKSKNQILEEKLRLRIIILFVIFAIIVSALRLGFIGQGIHNCVAFLTGNLYGVVYLALLVVCIYILCKAQIPRLNGPEAIGIYAIFISMLTIASIPSQPQASGMGVISTYLQSQQMNKGGFIGICLYGVFSSLFESLGALILSIIILIIGLALIFSKLYFQHQKTKKKKPKVSKQEETPVQTIVLKKKSHFFDFLSKDKEIPLFPDSAFDDVEEKIDPEMTSAFEFDQDNMKLDIKEKKPLKIKEEKESPQESYIEPPKKTDLSHYQLPPLSLLSTRSTHNVSKEKSAANKNAARLTNVLKQFGVNATIENAFIGPTITKYELKLEIGTRVNKILQLQDDIKLALATADIRIEAPIPGKPYVGIEVPNQSAAMVGFKDVLKSLLSNSKYQHNPLVVALGKDVSGKPVFAQLDKMPHLLIAGATGSGKSVCVNTIISSILMRAKPDEVKLILVDPKKVELSIYNGIPHLLAPVVTDPKKAAAVLREVVAEMERRYDLFASVNARNIQGYNEFAKTYNEDHTDEPKEILPYHVIILDEVADLMMVASKDVEDCIMRISQMARAAGIHLIVATQRPSTDIITGVIKANIPSRIAFAVSSSIDSRTILDTSGAEKLLGKGDMLFSPMGSSSPMRVQGCFVSDEEVSAIVHYVSSQQEVVYEDKYVNVKSISSTQGSDDFDEEDEEYEKCREFVIQAQKASTSLLQRKFRIGYNKAARIIDRLEEEGVIGPQLGSKPREVYIRQYHEEDL
ncbi:cell division protein FtsK [Massilimicrobiota sp. An105]|uniref:DNA translocase FtsK n=1 Tax=Massilimicrobiota sp. An105 TaxID=1965540 RepID=UPI000B39CE9A|nr:DNA translocase FtsK [Massilimicrobiota sp. An105]OUQ84211.1 cell division protein FtsK [Massilimicrobiota sp. An105]